MAPLLIEGCTSLPATLPHSPPCSRLSSDALNLLACLAEMATRMLEERQVAALRQEQARAAAPLQRQPSVLTSAVFLVDAEQRRWPVLWANKHAASLTGGAAALFSRGGSGLQQRAAWGWGGMLAG